MLEAIVEIWQLKKLVQTLVNLGQSKRILDVDEPFFILQIGKTSPCPPPRLLEAIFSQRKLLFELHHTFFLVMMVGKLGQKKETLVPLG